VTNSTQQETLSSNNDTKISTSALEKLKKLAAQTEVATNERARIMKALEELANSDIDDDETCFMQTVPHGMTSGSTKFPTSYKNPTLSPWVLIIAAIIENRRHRDAPVVPKLIYVSDELLAQLGKDMKYCIEQEFNGKSIPFTQLNGEVVQIPIVSAKRTLDIILPKDVVWCAN